jgi:hypothetical protein
MTESAPLNASTNLLHDMFEALVALERERGQVAA